MKKIALTIALLMPLLSYCQYADLVDLFNASIQKTPGTSIVIADINNDNLNDLIYTVEQNNTYYVKARFGAPTGNLENSETELIELSWYAIHFEQEGIVDIDQDGLLELIFTDYSGELKWFNFESDGSISSEYLVAQNIGDPDNLGGNYDPFDIVDFDGDGDLDIISHSKQLGYTEYTAEYATEETDVRIVWIEDPATSNIEHTLYSYSFYVSSTFNPITTSWYYIYLQNIELSDIDSDGDNDLIIEVKDNGGFSDATINDFYEGKQLKSIINQGNNQFENSVFDNLNSSYQDLNSNFLFSDLDNDGSLELIEESYNSVYIYDEPFDTSPVFAYEYLEDIHASDLNGDGFIDLTGHYQDSIHVLTNEAFPQFSDSIIFHTADHLSNSFYASGDILGTNETDIVLVYPGQGELFLLEQENFTFEKVDLIEPTIYKPLKARATDLDGDNIIDFSLAGQEDKLLWLKADLSGNIVDTTYIEKGDLDIVEHFFLNVDQDNSNDLIFTNSQGIFFAENDGNGIFGFPQLIYSQNAEDVFKIESNDVDGDGDLDLLILSTETDLGTYWLENENLNFVSHTINPHSSGIRTSMFSDLNNDDKLDVVFYRYSLEDSIQIFTNQGNGTFSNSSIYHSDFIYDILEIDYNFDGFVDLASRVYSQDAGENVIQIRLNNLDGTFANPLTLTEVGHTGFIDLLDFDNDLDIDILIQNKMYVNLGNNEFTSPISISNVHSSAQNYFPDVDINNDGFDDIVYMWFSRLSRFLYEGDELFSVSGRVFWDENENGEWDAGEPPFTASPVYFESDNFTQFVSPFGNYIHYFFSGSGDYTAHPIYNSDLWEISTPNEFYEFELNAGNPFETDLDFGFVAGPEVHQVEGYINPSNWLCGGPGYISITASNQGNTLPSGYLELIIPEPITLTQTSEADSVLGNTVYFSYSDINYGSNESFSVQSQFPGVDFIDSTLTYTLNIYNDLGVLINTESLEEIVACAYDPNDKTEHSGWTENGFVLGNDPLEYTIRFQNTGTDTAYTVVIEDPLPSQLVRNSMMVISASHSYDLVIDENDKAIFTFAEIFLPDSNVNEPESHGYVTFTIETEEGLLQGSTIENTAFIYFDFNPAIVTNTSLNTIFSCDSLANFVVQNELCTENIFEASSLESYIESYTWSIDGNIIGNESNLIYEFQNQGDYWLKFSAENPLCQISDSTLVTVLETPNANAGEDILICGIDGSLAAALSIGNWTGPSEIIFDDFENPSSTISSSSFGDFDLVWTAINGTCTDSDTVQITFTELPEIDAGPDLSFCSLEGILDASGSSFSATWEGPDQINISDVNDANSGIMADEFGTFELYWTSINDACINQDTVLISFLETPLSNAGPDTSFCGAEGFIMAQNNGFEGSWSSNDNIDFELEDEFGTNLFVNGQGTYEIVWTSMNEMCQSNDTVNVTFYEIPWVEIDEIDGVLYANTFGDNYQWYFNGDSISGVNGGSFTPTENGEYSVSVEGQNDCLGFSELFNFIIDGIEELNEIGFEISPNPFSDFTWIEINASDYSQLEIEILDASGKIIRREKVTEKRFKLERKNLADGLYILNLKSSKGVVLWTERLVLK